MTASEHTPGPQCPKCGSSEWFPGAACFHCGWEGSAAEAYAELRSQRDDLLAALDSAQCRLIAIRDFVAEQVDRKIRGQKPDWSKACCQVNDEAEPGIEDAHIAIAKARGTDADPS